MCGNSSTVAKHLSANIFTNSGGSIQLQQHIGLQSVLGPIDLEISNAGAQPHPFVLDVEHHVLQVHLGGHEVDAPKASVLVASVEGLKVKLWTMIGFTAI